MKFSQARFLAVILLIFSVARTVHASMIDRFGNTYKEIVVADDATDTVKLAAKELQKFSEKICNAKLKIVSKAENFPVIFVGESSQLKDKGISPEKLPLEGYMIKTGENYLAIVGRDSKGKISYGEINPWRPTEAYNPQLKLSAFGEAGTLTGVYEFLRKVGNARFYWPGELGTVINPVKNLTVPQLDVTGAPVTNYRYPWFCMFERNPESALWARRIGFGGLAPVMITHSYSRLQKYRDTHPEYFALVDGKRAFEDECVAMKKGHLCLTNPDVVKVWADLIIDYFEKHPDVDVYPLAPEDGLSRICECPNCQAELRPEAGHDGTFSYHIWNFTRKVGALVGKRFPNKYVGCLAYEKFRSPPAEIGYMPNTAVMFTHKRSRLANPEIAAELHSQIDAWTDKVDRIYLWDWYLDHWLPWRGLPIVFTDTIGKELKYMFKNPKYGGEFIESEGHTGEYDEMPTPGMQHLNLYVTARHYWDANLDMSATIDEYCKLFYGPGAASMKSFWLTAQEQRNSVISKMIDASPTEMFTPAVLIKLDEFLKEAVGKTSENSVYRKRIEIVKKEFDSGANRLMRLSEVGIKKLEVPFFGSKKPFENIKPEKFLGKSGEPYSPPTWLYAEYDRKSLHFKFLCFEPDMAKLKKNITVDDAIETWMDDSIEIFICPNEADRTKCYQLVLNANGVIYDANVTSAGTRDSKWKSEAKTKVKTEKNRWILEVSIPFPNIDIVDPNFTGQLAVNFYRNRSTQKKATVSCWTPVGNIAHYTPEKFGLLQLKK